MYIYKLFLDVIAAVAPPEPGSNTPSNEAGSIVGRIFPPFPGFSGSISLTRYFLTLFNTALYVGLVAALIYIVYGAIKWITSGGDIKALAAARNTITHAIMGVILLSLGLVMSQVVGTFVSPTLDDTNSKAVYICGYGSRKEQCDLSGIPPSECYQSITCHQVYSRILNEKADKLQMSYPSQYCFSAQECDKGCKQNELINTYKYCQPI